MRYGLVFFALALVLGAPLIVLNCNRSQAQPASQQPNQTTVTVTYEPQGVNVPCRYDVPDALPAALVTDGMWELSAYGFTDKGEWFWCWKASLVKFKEEHPDLRIVTIAPSVHFMGDWKGVPMKYFVFTEPKPKAPAEEFPK